MYSVRHGYVSESELKEEKELEAFRQRHIYLAGEAMQKEIGYMATSAATSIISGVLFGIANQMETKSGRTAMFVTGGITAGISLVGIAATIHFHNKAGSELRLSAGEVIYKF